MNYNPDLSTVRQPTVIADQTVHKALETEVTAANTAIVAALNAGGGAGAAITQAQFNIMLRNFLLILANNGTSRNVDYNSLNIGVLITNTANANGVNISYNIDNYLVRYIKRQTTLRRYCRYYADNVYRWAKTGQFNFHIGSIHGVPRALGHIGFDFADAIDPHLLTDAEQQAIDAAKAVGIFRSGTALVNTSHHYSGGVQIQSRAAIGGPRPVTN